MSQQDHQTHLEELPVPICKPALRSQPLNGTRSGKTPEKSDMGTSPSQKTTWVVINKRESASLTQQQQQRQVMLSQGLTEHSTGGLPAAGISGETKSTCTKASKQPGELRESRCQGPGAGPHACSWEKLMLEKISRQLQSSGNQPLLCAQPTPSTAHRKHHPAAFLPCHLRSKPPRDAPPPPKPARRGCCSQDKPTLCSPRWEDSRGGGGGMVQRGPAGSAAFGDESQLRAGVSVTHIPSAASPPSSLHADHPRGSCSAYSGGPSGLHHGSTTPSPAVCSRKPPPAVPSPPRHA